MTRYMTHMYMYPMMKLKQLQLLGSNHSVPICNKCKWHVYEKMLTILWIILNINLALLSIGIVSQRLHLLTIMILLLLLILHTLNMQLLDVRSNRVQYDAYNEKTGPSTRIWPTCCSESILCRDVVNKSDLKYFLWSRLPENHINSTKATN